MNFQCSIIIICRNEAENIEAAVHSILSLSDDIVVYDSGSTDGTIERLQRLPVRLIQGSWEGFGATRQKAAAYARHDWVLVVDADERVSPALAEELQHLEMPAGRVAYSIQLQNHIGLAHVRHGSWGHDFRLRLYQRSEAHWNDAMVHEKLVLMPGVATVQLRYTILHYTAKSMGELSEKLDRYASLTAAQYFRLGKRSTWAKRNLGPVFAFLKSFFLKSGFLDGAGGYRLAAQLARYTKLKYQRLHALAAQKNP